MEDPGKRLKILSGSETKELYGIPTFSHEERARYFSLDPLENNELDYYRSSQTKISFILQLGYFKAKKMFFVFDLGFGRVGTNIGAKAVLERVCGHIKNMAFTYGFEAPIFSPQNGYFCKKPQKVQ